jgi:outer membrane protein assembly factor BamA
MNPRLKKSPANNVFERDMAAYYHGMSLLRVLTVAAALAACGGGATGRVRKPGDEYLKAIEFEGVSLSHEGLLSGLALKRNLDAGRNIDEYQLTLDVQRIAGLYQRRGYFSVTVEPRVERVGDASTLIFKVVEGPRATVSVVITGLPTEISYEDARALVQIENGDPFNYDLFADAKAPLLAMVENAGYAHAQLDAQVLADRAKARATLRYAFDPGQLVRFGPITITGVDGALAKAARNRIPIREGDPYSTKRVAEAQQAITGIGRFSAVRVDVDRMSDATVLPVKVVLAEATRWEARAGGGLGFDTLQYLARLRASLSHAGWPTPLTTLGVEFRPAVTLTRDTCALVELVTFSGDCEPRVLMRLIGTAEQKDFLHPNVTADADGGLDYLRLEAYTIAGARARLGVGMPLANRRVQTRIGWQFGLYDFEDLSHALVAPDPNPEQIIPADPTLAMQLGVLERERLGAFSETISLDLRDNPFSPRRGVFGELRVTHGGTYAGGAYNYLQVMPEFRGYVPLGTAVLAARARFGVITGDVPPTERFYAGGASSHRGFPERHLSPTASTMEVTRTNPDGTMVTIPAVTVPIGGAAMVETGVELRVPFKLFGVPMGAAAFLDGGDVTMEPGEIELGNLHWAAGMSLRPYYLPIGPIRLDLAYRLNRTGAGNPLPGERWTFLFSLGEAF